MDATVREALDQGDLPGALVLISEQIEVQGPTPELLAARGRVLLDLGEQEDAMADAEALIAAEPDDPRGFELRGDVFFAQKAYPRAAVDLDLALERGGGPEVRVRRGIVHFYQEQYVQAVACFEEVRDSGAAVPNLDTYVSMARQKLGGAAAAPSPGSGEEAPTSPVVSLVAAAVLAVGGVVMWLIMSAAGG